MGNKSFFDIFIRVFFFFLMWNINHIRRWYTFFQPKRKWCSLAAKFKKWENLSWYIKSMNAVEWCGGCIKYQTNLLSSWSSAQLTGLFVYIAVSKSWWWCEITKMKFMLNERMNALFWDISVFTSSNEKMKQKQKLAINENGMNVNYWG